MLGKSTITGSHIAAQLSLVIWIALESALLATDAEAAFFATHSTWVRAKALSSLIKATVRGIQNAMN